ncbi:hypothetical protein [Streptomyces ipomoeae]|uniref:hypothetical protein n=1 Tax=Streptomyces ipomoeae TaxID=103232 RepID=UPI0011469E90|nr:hypothetical protein [Streptomyces ipomoeae]MDX2935449.1 hypothetical protein [Streptomyces ipomoeae]TQE28067.1 hypothetical protein SipoB123_10555 [Streptomyces ipomoeae]
MWDTVLDGDRRVCAACGTPVRSYQFRFHPPESAMFERCVGLGWCSGCRIYSATMVRVPRTHVLVDALASLPEDQRERLLRKEAALVDFLDGRGGEQRPSTPGM